MPILAGAATAAAPIATVVDRNSIAPRAAAADILGSFEEGTGGMNGTSAWIRVEPWNSMLCNEQRKGEGGIEQDAEDMQVGFSLFFPVFLVIKLLL